MSLARSAAEADGPVRLTDLPVSPGPITGARVSTECATDVRPPIPAIMPAMLRTIRIALVAIAWSLICGTAVLFIAMVRSTSPKIDAVIRFWARSIVRSAGIDLALDGAGTIVPGQRYILVANHYSYFDIPCILAVVPQSIRFLAKVSLFKIPIFGWALSRAGFIPIDRQNRRTAVKSFDLAAERIRKGNTIVVFPEEGRTRHRQMRAFKRGGFLLGIKTGLPILPLAIDSTFDIFPVGAKRITPGRVTIRVGEPIVTMNRSVREKESMAAEARAQIAAMLRIDPTPAEELFPEPAGEATVPTTD
jgi:1-acyl-sn-glycerol-3-phosphate acyltransferase